MSKRRIKEAAAPGQGQKGGQASRVFSRLAGVLTTAVSKVTDSLRRVMGWSPKPPKPLQLDTRLAAFDPAPESEESYGYRECRRALCRMTVAHFRYRAGGGAAIRQLREGARRAARRERILENSGIL